MRRSWYSLVFITIVASTLLITAPGCKKKVAATAPVAPKAEPAPPAPPPPPPPAPTISLNVSPAAIEKGQSTTLSWYSSNATNVTIDNGVGTVEPSGNRTINPSASTTYKARATGQGGDAVAEARVTVTAPPPPPPPPPVISDDEIFNRDVKDAFFDYDQYSIRKDAQDALQADARMLNERPNIRITIEGHCDERGSEKYNMALGDRRANAAKEYLTGQGVNSSRIDSISYGEGRNFCEEHNEGCWQLNRRAHMVKR